MIYLHEGVDGSGKSTGVDSFLGEKDTLCMHNPVDWNSKTPYKNWVNFLNLCLVIKKDIHIDRSFLSNKPYRQWAGESEDFTKEELEDLYSYPFVIVYYDSGTEYEDATKRGEDKLKTKSDYDTIKQNYKDMLKELKEKYNKEIYIIDWHKEEVKSFLSKR